MALAAKTLAIGGESMPVASSSYRGVAYAALAGLLSTMSAWLFDLGKSHLEAVAAGWEHRPSYSLSRERIDSSICGGASRSADLAAVQFLLRFEGPGILDRFRLRPYATAPGAEWKLAAPNPGLLKSIGPDAGRPGLIVSDSYPGGVWEFSKVMPGSGWKFIYCFVSAPPGVGSDSPALTPPSFGERHELQASIDGKTEPAVSVDSHPWWVRHYGALLLTGTLFLFASAVCLLAVVIVGLYKGAEYSAKE